MVSRRQSPVDIPRSAPVHDAGLDFAYRPGPATLSTANTLAIQFDCAPGSRAIVSRTRYELWQFHFHSPGEHTFDGVSAALELHLVHRTADGDLAVVGVLFDEGQPNAAFESMVATLDRGLTELHLDPTALLPSDPGHVRYDGSLTTAPYTEGVTWRVMTQRLQLSPAQLQVFRSLHDDNSRPVQPMNGRSFG